jgi:hypothetical protein
VRDLSNADVTWDATYDGFVPRVSEQAVAAFRADEETISTLLAYLPDPDKFVLAHVGLTQIAGLDYSTFPTWNGLSVHLGPDGRAIINPEQRLTLAKRWQSWHASSQRPRALP